MDFTSDSQLDEQHRAFMSTSRGSWGRRIAMVSVGACLGAAGLALMLYSSNTSGDPTVTQIASQYQGVLRKLEAGSHISPECKTALETMEDEAQDDEKSGGGSAAAKTIPTCTGTKKLCAIMIQLVHQGHQHQAWENGCMPTVCDSANLKKELTHFFDEGKKQLPEGASLVWNGMCSDE